MANEKIKFTTGLNSNLPSTKEAGKVYFAVGDNNRGVIYFDKDASTRIQMSNSAYNFSGILGATNGGTGIGSYTKNTMLFASSTSALSQTSNILTDGSHLTIGINSLVTNYDLYVNENVRASLYNVADKVNLQYNANTESLDFVFV